MLSRRSFVPGLVASAAVMDGLAATSGAAQTGRAGVAPDFVGIEEWVNTSRPLTMAELRGRVVLVDFWTYSCINCRRTVPYLNRWKADYATHGLQVVGIHTPEFGFERQHRNVADEVRSFAIRFPVGQDNGARTWRAWNNEAWPAFHLVDQDGKIVLVRLGEGHARELESAIRALLNLPPASMADRPGDDPDLSRIGTDEMYFGALHPTPQDPAQSPRLGDGQYRFAQREPALGEYQLDGSWARQGEALVLRSPRGGLRVRFSAAKLHLVAGAPRPATLRVLVDGGIRRTVEVERPTLYTLLDGDTYGEHLLAFETDTPGLSLFSATFG